METDISRLPDTTPVGTSSASVYSTTSTMSPTPTQPMASSRFLYREGVRGGVGEADESIEDVR